MKYYTVTQVLLLPKLQSYFAKFLQLCSSIALVYSTHPPVLDFIYLTRREAPLISYSILFLVSKIILDELKLTA